MVYRSALYSITGYYPPNKSGTHDIAEHDNKHRRILTLNNWNQTAEWCMERSLQKHLCDDRSISTMFTTNYMFILYGVKQHSLSLGTLVSSTNKTDRHDITELLLKVALTTITLTQPCMFSF